MTTSSNVLSLNAYDGHRANEIRSAEQVVTVAITNGMRFRFEPPNRWYSYNSICCQASFLHLVEDATVACRLCMRRLSDDERMGKLGESLECMFSDQSPLEAVVLASLLISRLKDLAHRLEREGPLCLESAMAEISGPLVP